MNADPLRALDRLMRKIAGERPPRRRPEAHEPGERARIPRRRLVIACGLAVVVPVIAAIGLVPIRADHSQTVGIVLVLPVVLVALLGAVGPAALAALSASVAYDFFLTAPYRRLTIDDPDDIVAAVTLAFVGLVVGMTSSRLARIAARDAARRSELHHLVEFARAVAERPGADRLTRMACDSLIEVLNLRDCRWRAGYHGDVGPVLLPDGNVMGYVSSLNADRAILPDELEVPAVADDVELGRFVLTPRHDHIASYEERLTAATIASIYAAGRGSA